MVVKTIKQLIRVRLCRISLEVNFCMSTLQGALSDLGHKPIVVFADFVMYSTIVVRIPNLHISSQVVGLEGLLGALHF